MSGSSSSPGCSPVPLSWEMSSSSGISMDTSIIGMAGKGSPQQLPGALPEKALGDPQSPAPTSWHCSGVRSCSEQYRLQGSQCNVMVGLGIRRPGF